ncbi:MAG: hypothetical protein QHJ82_09095 [Verrucomicrobiota bacterium]|nr:hypothetical protein [Verrucomicrobiota bacterium]
MGTFRIFEELSQVMDAATARKLTEILDAMYTDLQQTVTKGDFQELKSAIADLARVQTNAESQLGRLETVTAGLADAQNQTGQHLAELAEKQSLTEQRIAELADRQARTEQQVAALAEAQKSVEQRLSPLESAIADLVQAQTQLTLAQKETETALKELIRRVDVHDQRLAKLDGRTLETQFRDKAAAYLGRVLRRTRVLSVGDIADDLEGVLTPEEWDDLRMADIILSGRADVGGQKTDVFVVVEVSVTVDATDVERAARRAALLRKKGWKAIAVTAGDNATDELVSLAAHRGVAVLRDGQEFNWPQALAAA